MAMWERHAFGNVEQAVNFLNGVLIGDANLAAGAEVDGLTFIADIGAGEVIVTFTAKGRAWTPQEIVDKINASLTGVARVYSRNSPNPYTAQVDQRVLIERDGAITVKSTGTANALLGFSTTSHTTNAPVANTEVEAIEFQHSGATDLWVILLYR